MDLEKRGKHLDVEKRLEDQIKQFINTGNLKKRPASKSSENSY